MPPCFNLSACFKEQIPFEVKIIPSLFFLLIFCSCKYVKIFLLFFKLKVLNSKFFFLLCNKYIKIQFPSLYIDLIQYFFNNNKIKYVSLV